MGAEAAVEAVKKKMVSNITPPYTREQSIKILVNGGEIPISFFVRKWDNEENENNLTEEDIALISNESENLCGWLLAQVKNYLKVGDGMDVSVSFSDSDATSATFVIKPGESFRFQ